MRREEKRNRNTNKWFAIDWFTLNYNNFKTAHSYFWKALHRVIRQHRLEYGRWNFCTFRFYNSIFILAHCYFFIFLLFANKFYCLRDTDLTVIVCVRDFQSLSDSGSFQPTYNWKRLFGNMVITQFARQLSVLVMHDFLCPVKRDYSLCCCCFSYCTVYRYLFIFRNIALLLVEFSSLSACVCECLGLSILFFFQLPFHYRTFFPSEKSSTRHANRYLHKFRCFHTNTHTRTLETSALE